MKYIINGEVGQQIWRSAKPKESKLIPMLVVLSLISALQVSTQFFASTFGYQKVLGGHIGHHVYLPWSILQWATKWYKAYPNEFIRAGGVGEIVAAIGLLFVMGIKLRKKNGKTAK